MSSQAQIAANQQNAQKSTGPKSAEGKAVIRLNAFRHGLASAFMILPDEPREDFDELHDGLRAEHQPETPTEILLVESMAQHYWLKQRALRLQTFCIDDDGNCDEKSLALYLRYQTTHDRAFHKALNTLLKLRADKVKAEIGFVSQERKHAEETRKQAAEKRKQELHKWKVLRRGRRRSPPFAESEPESAKSRISPLGRCQTYHRRRKSRVKCGL